MTHPADAAGPVGGRTPPRRVPLYCTIISSGTPAIVRMPEETVRWSEIRREIHSALKTESGILAKDVVAIECFAGSPDGDDDPGDIVLAVKAFSGLPTLTRLDLYAWNPRERTFELVRRALPAPDYPTADRDRDGWYSDGDYEATGGTMTTMSPGEYLERVRPLVIDEASRDAIDDLKTHMLAGRPLDPLKIYADGREDGRHRAQAALELGTSEVPVILWNEDASRGIITT